MVAKPLQGKTILITRDASQAGGLKQMLEEKGAEVISIPTISIEDPPDWQPFDQAATELECFDWIVFGSVNAVVQTIKRLRSQNIDIRSLDLGGIAAVGDQTARCLEDNGWPVRIIPNRFQAEDLGDRLIAEGVSGKDIWLPRALVARNVLIEKLEKAGARVVITPVYRNAIPMSNRDRLREVLTNRKPDWITFTSSSTVDNFFKILDWDPANIELPNLASIGSITSKTIEEYSLKPEFTADPQNLSGLCEGIIRCQSVPSR